MAGGNPKDGAATARPRGRDLADRPGVLCANLLRAVAAYREQQFLLRVLFLLGPCTTEELLAHFPTGKYSILRRLRGMRRAGAVTVLTVHKNPAVGGMWALHGQAMPVDAGRRARLVSVDFERRTGLDRRDEPRDSWWTRPNFSAAYRQRWYGDS